VVATRDPEIAALQVESLKLVVKAEVVLEDLADHNKSLADFLDRASRYTEQDADDSADAEGA